VNENRTAVTVLLELRGILRDAYTDAGINLWLVSENHNLGGRMPVELLADSEYDRVLAEARRVGGEG
jgi:hypothetical protein